MVLPDHAHFGSLARVLARGAGAVIVLVGSLVLLGWALDLVPLKSVLPGWVPMPANTALAFVLAGVILVLVRMEPAHSRGAQGREKAGRVRRWVMLGCAGTVTLIGVLTLSEYGMGWALGIDQLLFTAAPDALGNGHPGRMAPASALNFLVLGGALLLANGARFAGVFQFLTLVGGLIGWLGLSHYLYGGAPLLPYKQMAMLTALSFLLLSAGKHVLRAAPKRQLRGDRIHAVGNVVLIEAVLLNPDQLARGVQANEAAIVVVSGQATKIGLKCFWGVRRRHPGMMECDTCLHCGEERLTVI
jgi:hypothetical protein